MNHQMCSTRMRSGSTFGLIELSDDLGFHCYWYRSKDRGRGGVMVDFVY